MISAIDTLGDGDGFAGAACAISGRMGGINSCAVAVAELLGCSGGGVKMARTGIGIDISVGPVEDSAGLRAGPLIGLDHIECRGSGVASG